MVPSEGTCGYWNCGGWTSVYIFERRASFALLSKIPPSKNYLSVVPSRSPPTLSISHWNTNSVTAQHQHNKNRISHNTINMASNPFQPTPPLRSNTNESQNSQCSGQMSPTSRATSPTEQSFFGAITAKVRGRSRSRSRDDSKHMAQQSQYHQQPQHITIASPTAPVRPSLDSTKRRSTGGSDPWRGRHSNDWLFGGWSATETAKGLMRRSS